jgi:catechol 2,3-dioxygenase-like lactoylglutathione lyase family enzyme
MIEAVWRLVDDAARVAAFYEGLGFAAMQAPAVDAAALGVAGAGATVTLRLGTECVRLVSAPDVAPYPADGRANDLLFQHLAIVVADMDAAYARLNTLHGWSAISPGPQTLPPESGAVRACKFRDPCGHPLELLWFPPGHGARWAVRPGLFLGIDHTAISVSDAEASVAFYGALGFRVAGRTDNHGPAQDRLDDLPDARVAVTSLRPDADGGIGIELLCYRVGGRAASGLSLAADWIVLSGGGTHTLTDPDGHRVLGNGAPACGPAT